MELKIVGKIEELKDDYLQFWMDVVNCESPTDYKGGAVTAFMTMHALDECGFNEN